MEDAIKSIVLIIVSLFGASFYFKSKKDKAKLIDLQVKEQKNKINKEVENAQKTNSTLDDDELLNKARSQSGARENNK